MRNRNKPSRGVGGILTSRGGTAPEFLAEKLLLWRKNTFTADCAIRCQSQLLVPDGSVSQAMRQEPKMMAAGGGKELGRGRALKILMGRWVEATGVFDQPGAVSAGHTR